MTPPEEGRPANAGTTPIQQARWAPEEGPSKAGTQPKVTDQGLKPVRSTHSRESCTQSPVKDRDQGQHDLKTKQGTLLWQTPGKPGQFDCQGNIPSAEVLITPSRTMRDHVTLRVEVVRKGEPGTWQV